MKRTALLIVALFISASFLHAQDTLPHFSVKNAGAGRIIIGWINGFDNIKQISIQRSFDSLKNYKTILTVPDPTTPQNGFVDTKATNDHMFYRLYILLDKGVYLFSDPQKPVLMPVSITVNEPGFDPSAPYIPPVVVPVTPTTTPPVTTVIVGGDTIVKAPPVVTPPVVVKPPPFVPSKYIYSQRDGYVKVTLPDDEEKKYSIRFFNEGEELLFELKNLKERSFKLDKTNFYKAGWYFFELYEDDKVLEKHKFYIAKDF